MGSCPHARAALHHPRGACAPRSALAKAAAAPRLPRALALALLAACSSSGASDLADHPAPGGSQDLGQAGLRFVPARRTATGPRSQALAVGDLDGDGLLDVAVASADSLDSRLVLLRGDGQGGLTQLTQLRAGDTPYAVAIADLNQDGAADLLSADYLGASISVYAGQPAARGRFRGGVTLPAGAHPTALLVGDLDGDGHPDVAAANQVGGSVSLFYNSDRAAGSPALGLRPASALPAGPHLSALGALPLAGATTPSLLVTSTPDGQSGALLLLRGAAAGVFDAATSTPTAPAPAALAIGDVTGDGLADAVLSHPESGLISVLPGDGRGGFGAARTYAIPGGPGGPGALALADLDQDGRLDVIVAQGTGSALAVLLQLAPSQDGSQLSLAAPLLLPACRSPSAVVSADLNRDGWTDLLTTCRDEDSVAVLLNSPAR